MTELSDSTALCNQLNFHESEDDNNNVNDIFITARLKIRR